MTAEHYEAWIKSHQRRVGDIDITDAVMERIAGKADKGYIIKQTWEGILLDIIQGRMWMRIGVLVTGVLVGIIRMMMQIYSVLFV